MNPSLQLKLFGSPQISYQDEPLNGFISAKVRALLIYLAVTARPHSRDHLAHLLWSDTPASMKVNLRKGLSNLRHMIGDLLVEDGKELVSLDRQQCWIDVIEFEQRINEQRINEQRVREQQSKAGSFETIAHLYTADFLAGFNVSVCYEFETWVLSEQSRLKSQMVDLLRKLASQAEQTGDLSAAIANVRRLLELEPWQEEAHRWLMVLLAQNGQRSAALAHFEVCKRVLKEELAVEPNEETAKLVEQIQQNNHERKTGRHLDLSENGTSTKQVAATSHQGSLSKRSNLPLPATSLLGREADQKRVADLLTNQPGRLVTLVGPPGIGKTRLAVSVADQLQSHFSDGVYFVPLAAINDVELVASTIVTHLGLTSASQQTPQATLIEFLHDKSVLLLLDNFEQILGATPIITELLSHCPKLHLFVTSRERLHLYAEQLYRVPNLAMLPAVTLFVQRAQALDIDFVLTTDTQAVVSEICQQLDCLPLAIELSAAHLELLTPTALLTQVRDQRLKLLKDGPRDLPERQRTLRNAIASSYHLLKSHEQALFRALGICVGGFDQEAVEGLGFKLSTLRSLIHKSLVQGSPANEKTRRFLLLETLREYALEQLAYKGENGTIASRYAEHYLALAEEAAKHLRGGDQAFWLDRLASDHDNLRAALTWTFANQQREISARIGIALWRFWEIRGHYSEGWQWLQRLVVETERTELRAELLYAQGQLAQRLAKYDSATDSFKESLNLFRQLGNTSNIAWAQYALGRINSIQGNFVQARLLYDQALVLFRQLNDFDGIASTLEHLVPTSNNHEEWCRWLEESLALRRQIGNPRGLAYSLSFIASLAIKDEKWTEARQYLQEQLSISEQIGYQRGVASSLHNTGKIAFIEGDYETAKEAFKQSRKICDEIGDRAVVKDMEWLGRVALKMRDYEQAQSLFEQVMPLHRSKNDVWGIAKIIGCFASLLIYRGRAWQALCLASAGAVIHEAFEIKLDKLDREVYEYAEGSARFLLSETDAATAWVAGRAMTREQAIEYALASSNESIIDQGMTSVIAQT